MARVAELHRIEMGSHLGKPVEQLPLNELVIEVPIEVQKRLQP